MKETAKAEEDPQRARPKNNVHDQGQGHTIDEGHTPGGNLDPVDPDPKEGYMNFCSWHSINFKGTNSFINMVLF